MERLHPRTSWAIRLDFAVALVDDEERCTRVANILVRPCFRELERMSIHRGDRWLEHGPVTVERMVRILRDRSNKDVTFDTKRNREIVATGEIRNGTYETNEGATRFNSHLVFPLVPADVGEVTAAICELADVLDAGAGFVAVEPTYPVAQELALGGFDSKPRPGLSRQRMLERRGRDRHQGRRQELLSGPEWGTFLGAQHLEKLDLELVRASGAFERVVRISPRLAFLQVTADPEADGRDGFEQLLVDARAALAPIMMDLSDVNLE
ncbi:MAG: hypothetical protein KF773_07875 [Deltaproteobacteria bacterium]|nr:hypothetical protein [Deltaproteobacteria bacterium]